MLPPLYPPDIQVIWVFHPSVPRYWCDYSLTGNLKVIRIFFFFFFKYLTLCTLLNLSSSSWGNHTPFLHHHWLMSLSLLKFSTNTGGIVDIVYTHCWWFPRTQVKGWSYCPDNFIQPGFLMSHLLFMGTETISISLYLLISYWVIQGVLKEVDILLSTRGDHASYLFGAFYHNWKGWE